MDNISRVCQCCQECDRKSTGEFKKVIDLKASGLSIYLHNGTNITPEKKRFNAKQDEIIVLYNPNEKAIKRYDYISELCKFKAKCYQCKSLIQRIRSAMDEVSDINASEIKSICQHCKRSNPAGKCKRCDFIANRFFCNRIKQFEERQIKIEVWLCKVRALLQEILEKCIYCRNRVHQKTDVFDRLLRELDTPTIEYKIDEVASSRIDRYSLLRETKDMLEIFIRRLRLPNTDRLYSSDESLYLTSSKTDTSSSYKYPMDKMFDYREAGIFSKEETTKILRPLAAKEADMMYENKTKLYEDSSRVRDGTSFEDGIIKETSGSKRSAGNERYSTKGSSGIKNINRKSRAGKETVNETKKSFSTKELFSTNKEKKQDKSETTNRPGIKKDAKEEIGSKRADTEKLFPSLATSKLNSKTFSKKSKINQLRLDSDKENKYRGLSLSHDRNIFSQKEKLKSKTDEDFKMLVLMEKNKLRNVETPMKKSEKLKEHPTIPKHNNKTPKINGLPNLEISERKNEIEESVEKIRGLDNKRVTLQHPKMIKGKEIVPFDPHYKDEKKPMEPLLFKVDETQYPPTIAGDTAVSPSKLNSIQKKPRSKSVSSFGKCKGIITYELSNREFIEKGWTILPTTKVMKRMNIYKMSPANPKNDWFLRHSGKQMILYDTGEKLAVAMSKTRGSWYYRNGSIALDFYTAKGSLTTKPAGLSAYIERLINVPKYVITADQNAGQRVVVYSNTCKDDGDVGKAIPVTVLASFDYLGNGVVYDHYGNIRLKYNQSEGIVIDDKVGPPGRWKWHMLNDPPVLQPVIIDTYSKTRDPRLDKLLIGHKDDHTGRRKQTEKEHEMLAIELENFVKEKANKMLQQYKPFQIRMKALKINNQFSLRILDQANIYLLFNDGPVTLKLDLGMRLISSEIIDTETAEVSQVATPYDKHPPRSQSLADIQDMLKRARKLGKVNSVS